jgi:hypothetical protein
MFGGGRSRVKEPCLVIYTKRRRDGVTLVARSEDEARRLMERVRAIVTSTPHGDVDFTEMTEAGTTSLAVIRCADIVRMTIEQR